MSINAIRSQNKVLLRFFLNGLFATIIHFFILYICINIIGVTFIGLANGVASIFGIIISFAGNKFFVFGNFNIKDILSQMQTYIFFYTLIAFMHASVMYIWSDLLGFTYVFGFIVVIFIQFTAGFYVNKKIIFKPQQGKI